MRARCWRARQPRNRPRKVAHRHCAASAQLLGSLLIRAIRFAAMAVQDERMVADFEAQLLRHRMLPLLDAAVHELLHAAAVDADDMIVMCLSLIHISEPTRLGMISYAVFCL